MVGALGKNLYRIRFCAGMKSYPGIVGTDPARIGTNSSHFTPQSTCTDFFENGRIFVYLLPERF